MKHPCLTFRLAACLAASLLAAHGACAQSHELRQTTLETVGSVGQLSAGLPDANALVLRGTWDFEGGNVLRAEVLEESKFGTRGGLGGVGFVSVLSPDWSLAGNLAFGHGGPNWATTRGDVEVSAKWAEARHLVTRVALYQARFEGERSDTGLRLALVNYLPNALVLEAGITLNVSEPGSVNSQMPFLSATMGHEGVQYVSLRISSGSEAYQALGAGQQLVDFRSRSIGLGWRRWVHRQRGFIVQAEHYTNPSYERNTLGAGVFIQW